MKTEFYKDAEAHYYAIHEDGTILHVNKGKPLVNLLYGDADTIPGTPRIGIVEIGAEEFSDVMVNAFLDMGAYKYLKLPTT